MSRQPNVRNKQKAQVNEEAIPNMDNGSIGKEKGAPVHTTKSRLRALALGVCLLVTLALGGIAARADEPAGQNTLTVFRSGGNDITFPAAVEKEYSESVSVDVNLYQIATAKKNKTYDIYDYTSVTSELDLNAAEFKDSTGAIDWEKVAQAAKKLADEGKLEAIKNASDQLPTATITAGSESVNIAPVDNGLFLVLSTAKGPWFEYTFSPSLTALPTKAAKNGVIMTSFDYGEWLSEVEIKLKPDYMPRYGALEIVKTVDEPSDEESLFVFHLTGKTPLGEDYDNYAGVTIEKDQSTGKTIVTHIPAGTTIDIVEDYAGRYNKSPVVIAEGEEKVIIADDDESQPTNRIHFSCKNNKGDDIPGSHGVENKFTYDHVGRIRKGDWIWVPTPVDAAPGYEANSEE